MRRGPLSLLILGALVTSGVAHSQQAALARIEDVLSSWRSAVHADAVAQSQVAVLATGSNEDGIPGTVTEWITTAQDYRSRTRRDQDGGELVVTERFAQRRDWNGFVRNIRGAELARLRTQMLERRVRVFGPPAPAPQATVSRSDDGKLYLVRMTPPGGATMTWYLDASSGLPVKSVRPGNDSEITTTYEDWTMGAQVMTPRRVKIAETDKPDYVRTQTSLRFAHRAAAGTFDALVQGPPDAVLAADAAPIPFTLENNHIVFSVRLNGHGPIGFLLDTGADETVINAPRIAEFGLRAYGSSTSTGGGGSTEYDYARGATFTLPGVRLRDQHVAVVDQSGLERALGIPLGGILGYDFISRFIVEIDYAKMLLTLHDPGTWRYSGSGRVVPITFDEGIPFTHGTISVGPKHDIPAYFVIDSGAAETMTLASPFVKTHDLVRLAQTNAFVNRAAGLENQFFAQSNVRGHIDRLVLGDLTENSIPVNLSVNVKGAYASPNFSGTIGESIFERYHVFLDYPGGRVILEPTAAAREPFPERRTYGLSLLASGSDLHTYTVTAVRPGSQAEKDGFRKADVIAGLDHRSAAQFSLSQLRDQLMHEGARYGVDVMRASETLTIAAQIRLVSLDRG